MRVRVRRRQHPLHHDERLPGGVYLRDRQLFVVGVRTSDAKQLLRDELLNEMPLLFSYGTLQEPEVQLATFGRVLHGERDELVGFEQSLVRIEGPQLVATSGRTHHANVTFSGRNDSRVSGTVFEVTDAELVSADQYEQLAAYKRIPVRLASKKQAWVYVDARSAPLHPPQ